MKTKIFAALLGAGIVAAGCVKTVNDQHAAAVPFVKDKLEGRYERPMGQVYSAAVEVVRSMGTISRESILSPGTNEVKTIEGKVNDRRVWVRVESAVDPKVTAVTVQARTSGGGSDLPLTHEIEKQIALKLAQ
jgi:hypothetical protein